jgi:hypothetical protein
MADHHDSFGSGDRAREFETAKQIVGDEVAGDPRVEPVANPDVEDDLGGPA